MRSWRRDDDSVIYRSFVQYPSAPYRAASAACSGPVTSRQALFDTPSDRNNRSIEIETAKSVAKSDIRPMDSRQFGSIAIAFSLGLFVNLANVRFY
jgi:hypothetical protein